MRDGDAPIISLHSVKYYVGAGSESLTTVAFPFGLLTTSWEPSAVMLGRAEYELHLFAHHRVIFSLLPELGADFSSWGRFRDFHFRALREEPTTTTHLQKSSWTCDKVIAAVVKRSA